VRALAASLLLLAATTAAAPRDLVGVRRERRARLAGEIGKGYAIVLAQPFTDTLRPPQEGNYLYLTGVMDPGGLLLLAGPEARPLTVGRRKVHEVLFLRGENDRFAQFHGIEHRPGKDAEETLGVEAVQSIPRGASKIAEAIHALLPRHAKLFVPSYRGADQGLVREVRRDLLENLRKNRANLKIGDPHGWLVRMRSVKDAFEVAAIDRAAAITAEAFREAIASIRPGSSEAAVDGALIHAMRKRNARPAYTFVVASGLNSTFPHYFRNNQPLRGGELLLIDAGAAVERYAADVSRTFPVSGRFTKRQREIYLVCLRAQLAGIAAVRPGATYAQIDAAARKVIREAGLDRYFTHYVGHHVGLDVHDPMAQKLAPGMTITVEPGIYIPEERIGIRIEDVVLVTAEGSRVLSAGFPKEPGEIEALFR
jgi:Xaa-Pro aminopeptidase